MVSKTLKPDREKEELQDNIYSKGNIDSVVECH